MLVSTKTLIDIAEEVGLEWYNLRLPRNVRGYYSRGVALISSKVNKGSAEFRCLFATLLGTFLVSPSTAHIIYSSDQNFLLGPEKKTKEFAIWEYAVDMLIDPVDFDKAYKPNASSFQMQNLAKRYNVLPSFIYRKIQSLNSNVLEVKIN